MSALAPGATPGPAAAKAPRVMLSRIAPWAMVIVAVLYFLLPLVATFQFSLSMIRGTWSFQAYRVIFADAAFQATFTFSLVCALATIVLGAALVVPTAYWVRLRLPKLRPVVEFVTLLPLVIPPIVLVFGYLRLYNSSSWLPFTGSVAGTNLILVFGYTVLALPYMYRAVDTGMQAIDIRTLTEAAESLGARRSAILWQVILPNVRPAVMSGAFLTFAIVIGEFVLASLLNRPAFGPYLQNIGANRAYEPAALAMISFAITWGCMVLLQIVGGRAPGRRREASVRRSLFSFARRAPR